MVEFGVVRSWGDGAEKEAVKHSTTSDAGGLQILGVKDVTGMLLSVLS